MPILWCTTWTQTPHWLLAISWISTRVLLFSQICYFPSKVLLFILLNLHSHCIIVLLLILLFLYFWHRDVLFKRVQENVFKHLLDDYDVWLDAIITLKRVSFFCQHNSSLVLFLIKRFLCSILLWIFRQCTKTPVTITSFSWRETYCPASKSNSLSDISSI